MDIEVTGLTDVLSQVPRPGGASVRFTTVLADLPNGARITPQLLADWLASAPEPGCLWIVVDLHGDGLDVFKTRAEAVAQRDAVRAQGVTAKIYPLSRSLLLPNL